MRETIKSVVCIVHSHRLDKPEAEKGVVSNEKSNKVFKFLFAMVLGMLISAFSMGSYTAHAEAQQAASAELEQAAPAEADNAGSGAFLIMGGMLLIILAVVITVVASFVVTAPIVDEI